MINTFYYTELYACLAGWRLIVLANRAGCEDDMARKLHDRLLFGVSYAMESARDMNTREREILAATDDEDFCIAQCLYKGYAEILDNYRIDLMDRFEIDYETTSTV